MNAVKGITDVTKTVIMLLALMPALVIEAIVLIKIGSHAMVDKSITFIDTDNHTIADINECTEGTDECEEHCYNTVGSYSCRCSGPGYRLHSDGTTCESEPHSLNALGLAGLSEHIIIIILQC